MNCYFGSGRVVLSTTPYTFFGNEENVYRMVKWKMRSAECGKGGVWKTGSVENAECGKCGVFKKNILKGY